MPHNSSGAIALTAARVPTGIKHGVAISPCGVTRPPLRASPSARGYAELMARPSVVATAFIR